MDYPLSLMPDGKSKVAFLCFVQYSCDMVLVQLPYTHVQNKHRPPNTGFRRRCSATLRNAPEPDR